MPAQRSILSEISDNEGGLVTSQRSIFWAFLTNKVNARPNMGVCTLVMQMMTNIGSGSVGTSINVAGSKVLQVFLSH